MTRIRGELRKVAKTWIHTAAYGNAQPTALVESLTRLLAGVRAAALRHAARTICTGCSSEEGHSASCPAAAVLEALREEEANGRG